MARWQLTEAAYLMVADCFWEQMETDRESGRKKTKKFPVPMYLDPKDPSCWTHKTGIDVSLGGNAIADGAIVLYQGESDDPKDLQLIGIPIPGMHPLDDEAKEITAKTKQELKWRDDKDFYQEGRTYADVMLEKIADRSGANDEIAVLQKQIAELMATMTQVVQQNAQLMAHVLQPQPSRRV